MQKQKDDIGRKNFRVAVHEAFERVLAMAPFRMTWAEYNGRVFGNFVIVFESSELRFRVIRDRLQYFVDFAPTSKTTDWIDQDVLFHLVGAEAVSEQLAANDHASLSAVATAASNHLELIRPLLRPDRIEETEERAQAFRARRAQRLFSYSATERPSTDGRSNSA